MNRSMLAVLLALLPETGVPQETRAKLPWDGRNHAPKFASSVERRQHFGYDEGRQAIGGMVERSLTPASYAKVIPPVSLDVPLKASGRLRVSQSQAGSGLLLGWFRHDARGWRMPNSLAIRLDGERDHFRVFFEYGTADWQTGSGQTFVGRYQDTPDSLIPTGEEAHNWQLEYDPRGANGNGEILLLLDGQAYRHALAPGHRRAGAQFDRFGLVNQQIDGQGMTVWIDQIELQDEEIDLSQDPQWEGQGNTVTYNDARVRPQHDLRARAKEIGGLVWRPESTRPEDAAFYGAPIDSIDLTEPLEASGVIRMPLAAADSAVLLGWFNTHTAIGAPPDNFLGILIEGPSRSGHYFRPVFGSSDGLKAMAETGPLLRPDNTPQSWSLSYRDGRIMATLAGEEISLDLDPAMLQGGARFNRFGLVTWARGGHFLEAYVRDLQFTGDSEVPLHHPANQLEPRLIPATRKVFLEELTWMEVRDAITKGTTTAIVATGGIEQNGPFVALGKHNYVLQATTEAIAHQLGNALIAPIVKYVPEGRIEPPSHHMRYPGTISLRPETFEAVLSDICGSLKQHGFRDLVLIGDSGDNQTGMARTAHRMNQEWADSDVRVHYVPEYYREDNRGRKLMPRLVTHPTDIDPRLKDQPIHSAYRYEAIMATIDPELIRASSRQAAGLFQVDGYDLGPMDQTVANGRAFIDYHAGITVKAIRAALANRN